jgi:uncharacterized membrane protein
LTPVLRRAFIAASIGWAILLVVAPWFASRPSRSVIVYGFAAAVYAIGSAICHQLPARSFHLWAAQMPVCARCTGIYAGAAVAAALAARPASRPFVGTRTSRVGLAVAALPTIATLAYEWTAGQTPPNWVRGLAGLPLGAMVAWIILAAGDARESG